MTAGLPQLFVDHHPVHEPPGKTVHHDQLVRKGCVDPWEIAGGGEMFQRCHLVSVANYDQAGAIEFFGPALGLPPAISGHNNYWLWGPGDCEGQVLIIIGGGREDYLESFAEVTESGHFDCGDCMPYEDNKTLWVARGMRSPIADMWPQVKHFR